MLQAFVHMDMDYPCYIISSCQPNLSSSAKLDRKCHCNAIVSYVPRCSVLGLWHRICCVCWFIVVLLSEPSLECEVLGILEQIEEESQT